MSDNRTPSRPGSAQRVVSFVLVAVALAGIALAIYVVVRNTRRIEAVKPVVTFEKPTPEQELAAFKVGMRRRMSRLTRRYERSRASSDRLSPEQAALGARCDSGFVRVRALLDDFVLIADPRAAEAPKRVLLDEYRELLGDVSRFGKTLATTEAPELDSLDEELLRVVGEE